MTSIQIISKNLRKISNLYNRLLVKQFSALDLDNYVEILLIISAQEHPHTQNQLAELFQIDKVRMVNILFNLSQKGLIEIARNPADRREHLVYLTPKAETIIPAIRDMLNQTTLLAQDGITKDKLICCFEVLKAMEKNLINVLTEK